MKNKTGFTLIELLAVIVILGIISAIAVSLYSGYIDSSRNRTYKAAEKSMMSSTTSLLQQCRDKEEKGEICKLTDKQIPSVGASGIVYLKQLVENGYMKDVKDPKDTSKSCAEESYVLIKGEDSGSLNNKTEYQVCLICGDYITEGCSDVDYANVEKPTIVGKNNDGSLLANNGWLTTEKGTLEATFSEDVTEKIKYKYKWYKDGVEIPNTNKRKIEVTEEGTYKINVTNEIETRNIDSDEFKVNIDNVAPIDVDFSYVVTTKSIKVTGTGTGVSRLMYSFSKDNGSTWTSYQENNIYEFKNLTTGTYNVKIKVRNMSMHETNSETKSVTLATLDTPTYSVTPSGWSQSKVVKINYQAGYTNQYKKDNGEWVTYSSPLTLTTNALIIARISDGVNYVAGSSLTVNQIDSTAPTVSSYTYTRTGSTITVTATGVDSESGIYGYQFSKDNGGTWTSIQTSNVYTFNNLGYGPYQVKSRVINNTYPNYGLNSMNYKDSVSNSIYTMTAVEYVLDLQAKGDSTLYTDPTGDANVHYYGPSVNNYIKVGTETFRILGVMKNVRQSDGTTANLLKLMRSTSVGNMQFGSSNVWTSSTILNYLNNNYAGTLASVSGNIANVVWYTNNVNSDINILTAYNQERTGSSTYTGKYGLIYLSDYGYTTSYTTCQSWLFTFPPYPYNHSIGSNVWGDFTYPCAPNSWLAISGGFAEWILPPYPSSSYHWNIRPDGVVGNYFGVNMSQGVRPAIYLTKTTRIISGNGSSSNPYVIG